MKTSASVRRLTLLTLIAFSGCTGWNKGKLTRPSLAAPSKLAGKFPNVVTVASSKTEIRTNIAYIEYDANGVLLQPQQLRDAEREINLAAKEYPDKHLIVVHFIHGWKNGSMSGNAASFQKFIAQLGSIGKRKDGRNFSVFGIYHAWPGAPYGGPLKVIPDAQCQDSEKTRFSGLLAPFLIIPEQLTVWDRWKVATKIASNDYDPNALPQVMRGLNTFIHQQDGVPQSLLIGHSMGGLISERAVVKDMVTKLDSNEFPDLVFLMNSAAPAIHAKRALQAIHEKTGAPRVFSITSTTDNATNKIAKTAFSIKQVQMPAAEGLNEDGTEDVYMKGCPGHHRRLISNDIVATNKKLALGPEDTEKDWLLEINIWPHLERRGSLNRIDNDEIGSILPGQEGKKGPDLKTQVWRITSRLPTAGPRVEGQPEFWSTIYPIVQVPKDLIKDHCDIWDSRTVSVLATAIRMSGILYR